MVGPAGLTAERFVLRVDPPPPYHGERNWTLASDDGRALATYDAPIGGVPIVRPERGGPYRVEPYASGWRLVARATSDDEPLLWYTGRWVRSGGVLLVAPDREYDVRSSPLRRLDLHVREGRRRILEAHADPKRDDRTEIRLTLLEPPWHGPDAELLVGFLGALLIFVLREGRHWRGLGAPA